GDAWQRDRLLSGRVAEGPAADLVPDRDRRAQGDGQHGTRYPGQVIPRGTDQVEGRLQIDVAAAEHMRADLGACKFRLGSAEFERIERLVALQKKRGSSTGGLTADTLLGRHCDAGAGRGDTRVIGES